MNCHFKSWIFFVMNDICMEIDLTHNFNTFFYPLQMYDFHFFFGLILMREKLRDITYFQSKKKIIFACVLISLMFLVV